MKSRITGFILMLFSILASYITSDKTGFYLIYDVTCDSILMLGFGMGMVYVYESYKDK